VPTRILKRLWRNAAKIACSSAFILSENRLRNDVVPVDFHNLLWL
jgi:hypothetical protein